METNENKNKCSVIVSSFSSYSDVWVPFFTLFFKYWPDCPYDIYLITDKVTYPDKRVKTILLEKDMGWPRNTRYALGKIDTPYFMMFMEDFLMIERVDNERINDLLSYTVKNNIDYLRLYPSPPPDKNFDKDMKVGEIGIDAPYRLSLMTAIWRKETFLELLKDEETIWQMELLGSERSRNDKYKFYSVFKKFAAINYFPATAIKKGEWRYDAVEFCKKHGIIIDRSKRPIEKYRSYIRRILRGIPMIGRVVRFLT